MEKIVSFLPLEPEWMETIRLVDTDGKQSVSKVDGETLR